MSMLRSILVLLFIALATADNNLRTERPRKDPKEYEGPITIAGHTYASRKEFGNAGKRCATVDPTPEELFAVEQTLATIPHELAHGVVGVNRMATVNVHFHIIQTTSGQGAVSQETINAQMNVLNAAYHQVNAKFVLKGVHQVVNNAWYDASPGSSAERQMKTSLRIGGANVLNVYTVTNRQGILGWATFPWNARGSSLAMDGVVIDYRSMPGGDMVPYNLGVTLVHEGGHWMGLLHTFQGGCMKYGDQGDMVKDTPCVKEPNYGCPSYADSCPGSRYAYNGPDPVHNYMDYGDDDCLTQFTKGQKQRMRQSWLAYRKGK